MKRTIYILLILMMTFGISYQGHAQNREDQKKQRWEEMKTKRAAFFTQRIGLTSSEAQAFWPVFYELQNKKGELHFQMTSQFRNQANNRDGKMVFDFAKANEDLINLKVQEARLERFYFEKFKTILSPEKLFNYYGAERDWANKLLQDLENRGSK